MAADDILQATLDQFGLGGEWADSLIPGDANNTRETLAQWAWRRWTELGGDEGATASVLIELRQQSAFHRRFPSYAELARQGRAPSPEQMVQYEQTFAEVMRAYGVSDSLYDFRATAHELMGKNVSASEVAERAAIAAQATLTAPAEVRQALQDLYGVGPGDMVAYWLDPDNVLPKLQQRWEAAQVGGAAAQYGFDLSRQRAEELASRGVSFDTARTAAEEAALLGGLTAGDNSIGSRDLLLDARLGDVAAQREVERAVLSRRARGEGGGNAVETQAGVVGLGSTSGV